MDKIQKPRNKARAPGMDFLGIPMQASLKKKIREAAKKEDRNMADWARLKLRDAAEDALAAQPQLHQPYPRITPARARKLRVAEDPPH